MKLEATLMFCFWTNLLLNFEPFNYSLFNEKTILILEKKNYFWNFLVLLLLKKNQNLKKKILFLIIWE